VVTILSATGKPTSRNGLIEELRQTPAFAPLVQGASQSEQAAHARKVAETLGVKH
jgi:hypothetical protein